VFTSPLRALSSFSTRFASSALLVFSATQVSAAGFEFPESGSKATQRSGAFIAGVNDPTAGFLNPGALSRLRGLQFTYNHNLIWSDVTFQRDTSVIPPTIEGEVGRGESSNQDSFFPLNGLIALSYKPEGSDLTFGGSVLGPNGAGSSRYDVSGAQRYMMTELEGILAFAGLSVAYGGDHWGVGVTPQYAFMPMMRYQMVVDGTLTSTLNPYESDMDVEAEVSVSDYTAFTAQVGAWYRPNPQFEIAASGRVLPVHFNAQGGISIMTTPTGTPFVDSQLEIEDGRASFDLTLPPVARLGLRYRELDGNLRSGERFDVELAVVYEAWHMVDSFDVKLDGIVKLLGETPLTDVTIEKRWRDTVSVRLGGTYHVSDALSLSMGGFYEQGASEEAYAHIDFPSFDRSGASVGLGYRLELGERAVELMLGGLHIFKSSSSVSETYAKVFQQRPLAPCPDGCEVDDVKYSGVPANAGTISVDITSLSLGVKFEL